MEITKKDFDKISGSIIIVLVLAIFFIVTAAIFETDSIVLTRTVIVSIGIVLLGTVLFSLDTIKYLRSKSYFSDNLSLKKIGGLVGLKWFVLLEIVIFISSMGSYDGTCPTFTPGKFNRCTFYYYMTDTFGQGLILISSLLLIVIPIVMFFLGFFVDRYTAKKINEGQTN